MESSNQPTLPPTPPPREAPWTSKNAPNWYVPSPDHATWHLIVRKPFQELREFADWVQINTRMFVIGQHDADEDVNTTHCHFMINGCKSTIEGLRKELKKSVKNGREEYAIMTKTERERKPYDEWMLAVYCLKGDINNHKLGKYTHERTLDIVSAWVNYETVDPKDKITTQYELIKSMIPKMKSHSVIVQGEYGDAEYENAVIPCQENFNIMCKVLNAHEVRTSRHELERMWVTLLRQHTANQNALYASISASVFR